MKLDRSFCNIRGVELIIKYIFLDKSFMRTRGQVYTTVFFYHLHNGTWWWTEGCGGPARLRGEKPEENRKQKT